MTVEFRVVARTMPKACLNYFKLICGLGQIAAMTFALKRLQRDHPEHAENVGLLLVVSEETDHVGMLEANLLDIRPDYLVVGEPTENRFGHAQKGALKVS